MEGAKAEEVAADQSKSTLAKKMMSGNFKRT
jgi:hypothetical protein